MITTKIILNKLGKCKTHNHNLPLQWLVCSRSAALQPELPSSNLGVLDVWGLNLVRIFAVELLVWWLLRIDTHAHRHTHTHTRTHRHTFTHAHTHTRTHAHTYTHTHTHWLYWVLLTCPISERVRRLGSTSRFFWSWRG